MKVRIQPQSFLERVSVGLSIVVITVLILAIVMWLFMENILAPNGWFIILISVSALLVISAMGTLVTGLIAIMKSHSHTILVFVAMFISLVGLLLFGSFLWGSPSRVSSTEIVEYFLADHAMKEYYNVFEPELSLPVGWDQEENVRAEYRRQGLSIDHLVSSLSEVNQKPTLLNIPSSTERGYLIDYNGKFESYFEKDGGGWVQLRQENPQVQAIVNLSVPAYDPRTGLMMIYVGWAGDSFLGEGNVLVYKYVFGKMILVTSLVIWIS
jgi:hypothetical protein